MTILKGDSPARFGHTELPDERRRCAAQGSEIRVDHHRLPGLRPPCWSSRVLGNSQAMKAAWVEDLLSFLPPISFLLAARIIRRKPSEEHPYGFHRAVGIAHVVAAVALTVMGAYLIVDSGIGLLSGEHPTIGGFDFFGQTIWLGWVMMAAMLLTAGPPIYLGHVKMKLAEKLHDKVLYADADMNKADWMTAAAAAVGVAGIGLGWWWADYAAALIISGSILHDGVRNTRAAVSALMDKRARTYDDGKPHPIGHRLDEYLGGLDWTETAQSRIRDEGHVFHVESFVVPAGAACPPSTSWRPPGRRASSSTGRSRTW